MKRMFALFLAGVLLFGLISCGKQSTTQSGQSSGSSGQSSSSNKNNSGQTGQSSGNKNNNSQSNKPSDNPSKPSSTNQGSSSAGTITAEQLAIVLEEAGYVVEDADLEGYELAPTAIDGHYYEIYRYSDYFDGEGGDAGFAAYLVFAGDDAESFYNEILRDSSGEHSFQKSTGSNYSKAVAVAQFGDHSEYGETYIVCRVENVVVVVYVDWDDYQDSDTPYDHAAQKAIESFGY